MITPVILAGGSGSRLWPLSRTQYPKQFLSFDSNETMLQATFSRLKDLEYLSSIVICNEDHRFIVAEQLRFLDKIPDIILESVGRNTAPAVALAACHALSLNESSDPTLLVLAADHVIKDSKKFNNAIQKALPLAAEGKLVTFGIVPNKPETGYGYIKRGIDLSNNCFSVDEFKEKPDLQTAELYIESGEYYWNSGMFMFKASSYLTELKKHSPEILDYCAQAIKNKSRDLDFIRVDSDIFEKCPNNSIDYAIMEKTKNSALVPLDAGWNDIGSWSALWDIANKDDNGNVEYGDTLLHNSTNNFVYSSDRLITMEGIDNTIVVETKDALLIINKDKAQNVRNLVTALNQQGRSETHTHREVYRPWGKYDSIDKGYRYQVKRITVDPGEKLSVQLHHHRAEHWIVVCGTAKVVNGEETQILTENESAYIPIGTIHSLENPGKIPLEIIEVQSGSYLGEDDIVRLSDEYGRD